MIVLRDLHKSYTGAAEGPVLRGVDLTIEKGEFVALLGKSGSGKTTLLNIIGGLDRDFKGQASVAGRDLLRMRDGELSRFRNRTISFVFQTFNLLPHLTCRENVAFPDFFSGRTIKATSPKTRAMQAMERVGIAHKADALPNLLSGGERQRVAIARAIFQSPEILLADEPTGNLDTRSGRHVMDLFMELNRTDGVTVILVTHDEALASLAHRVVRIVDGRIDGGPA